MTEISAQVVMDLRQKTGAKMMDAKRALVEADGDFGKAVEILREKGLAEAAKRTHRATVEGMIATAQLNSHGAASLAEVNCETDFVAKTDQFQGIAQAAARWMLEQPAEVITPDELSGTLVAEITAAISKTGENIQFKRGVKFASTDGVVESYIHLGGKIGVLVQIGGSDVEAVRVLAKDLAMQVAAASPEFLSREAVPQETVAKEMEIYRTQASNEGKREEFLDKIATGRLEKYFKDACLLEQPFIKDPDKQVKTLVEEVAKSIGATLVVQRFVRYQLGQ